MRACYLLTEMIYNIYIYIFFFVKLLVNGHLMIQPKLLPSWLREMCEQKESIYRFTRKQKQKVKKVRNKGYKRENAQPSNYSSPITPDQVVVLTKTGRGLILNNQSVEETEK